MNPEIERESSQRPSREQLRYALLHALNDAPRDVPVRYYELVAAADNFDLRAAASWLVEYGYARWVGGHMVITEYGRHLLRSAPG